MIRKLSLAGGLIVAGMLAGPQLASAAMLPQTSIAEADQSLVLQVKKGHGHGGHHHHYRHFRHHHRHHGLHLYRYRPYAYYYGGGYVAGYGGGGYCSTWREECADRWGWRTRGYYRCMYRHGC